MGRTRSFLIRFTDEEYALLEEMAEEDKDAKTKKRNRKIFLHTSGNVFLNRRGIPLT